MSAVEEDIVELYVCRRPTLTDPDTTVVLSDSDSESEKCSSLNSTSSNSKKEPHIDVTSDDSEDSDTPEIICVTDDVEGSQHTQLVTKDSGATGLPPQAQPERNATESPPVIALHRRLTVVSWNIDGLSDRHLAARMTAVCRIIRSLNVDIVFLQEVVPSLNGLVMQHFPDYMVIPGSNEGYFTSTLLRKCSVHYVSHAVLEFSSTKMERNITCTEATFNDHPLVLMNTHLESMGYSSEVRKTQLKKCFRHCVKQPQAKTVIFGGDMNLRDHEVDSVGGLPLGIEDVWEVCGRSPSQCYTWDMTCNDNLDWTARGAKPRCRFDRIYVRLSQPPYLKPGTFKLLGQERTEFLQCYPSDHWGLFCEFHVVQDG